DSVFSIASSVRSKCWPETVSPQTNTRRWSRPSSSVREAGSILRARMGGKAGLGGSGLFLLESDAPDTKAGSVMAIKERKRILRLFIHSIPVAPAPLSSTHSTHE